MPQNHVEPCYRCGRPAEQPLIATGHLAGHDQDHLPLCVDCLEMLMEDARAFWEGLRRKRAAE
jgi:hypothetical protein